MDPEPTDEFEPQSLQPLQPGESPRYMCEACGFTCDRDQLSEDLGFTCKECFKRTIRRTLPQMRPVSPLTTTEGRTLTTRHAQEKETEAMPQPLNEGQD